MIDEEKVEKAVKDLLVALGENVEREGLKETPKRVAKMLSEVLEGQNYSNAEIANMYNKCFTVDSLAHSMVVVKGIETFSYCEHHLALMYDMKVDVGYIPKHKVIGLSKIPRIVEMCCKRLQLQERIGKDIAEVLGLATSCEDIIVRIRANHSCVAARGVKARESITTTVVKRGQFATNQALCEEFFNM